MRSPEIAVRTMELELSRRSGHGLNVSHDDDGFDESAGSVEAWKPGSMAAKAASVAYAGGFLANVGLSLACVPSFRRGSEPVIYSIPPPGDLISTLVPNLQLPLVGIFGAFKALSLSSMLSISYRGPRSALVG